MSSDRDSSEISLPFQLQLRQIELDEDIAILFEFGPGTQTFLNGGVPGKQGRPPASKSAVEGMPRVEIKEEEGGSCVICLEDWSGGEVAAEMPCKHRFHSKCVVEWLGIHGTCPLCRYEMPVEDELVEEVDIMFGMAINGGGRRSETASGGESEADSEPMNETEV
ncbi:PREDICTED: E3 ubiquitin-protein ligase RING1 [Tarenaya hassleriana]|uniref:E3 ubiquitin-protein ligase RING1 n=1 Tax=Tarenaya hassleriana TaxID=28532 RepID=UPI00053C4BF6|nr:PREDICTED: E3 ubiquitin-protein ligase RING1 [Tarenaya hassleriana]